MEEQEDVIKNMIKERYGKIALTGNSDCCCMPGECCDNSNNNSSFSPMQAATVIGYDTKELESVPYFNITFNSINCTYIIIKMHKVELLQYCS